MKSGLLRKCFVAAAAAILSGIMLPTVARVGSDDGEKVVRDSAKMACADSISRNDSRRYDYIFAEAIRQQNAGRYAAALDLLNHCIAINPRASEAYYQRSMYYAELDSAKAALSDIERAAALSPDNDYYQEKVAQYYIGTGDYGSAIKAYERLYEHHRDRSDVLNILSQLYRQQKDYANMLRTAERIEQVDGASDETALAKMNAYELQGEKSKARAELQKLVDTHPYDASYKVMLGNWLLQNGQKEDAHSMFAAAISDDPDNETAQGSMFDYYRSVGQDSLADTLRKRMLLGKNISSKTKLMMLLTLVTDNEKRGGDSVRVLNMLDSMMAADKTNGDVAVMKASYMSRIKMPDSLIFSAYAHVVDIAPDNAAARVQLIQYLWDKERWDEVVEQCAAAVQYNPDEMVFYYFMGLANYQKKDEDAALDAFRRGVGEINEQSDPAIVSNFYAIMGDILFSKKMTAEAFAAYDSCLQWKEDNISCLNNYAYYLSEMGLDLRRAEQMSYQTVKAEPNNPTYLDTYAWILYMQDRHDEAKTYIDQALAVDTDSVQSSVIIEHAGDIYAINGDRTAAEQLWQRAIEAGGDKAALRKKINKKKFVKKTKKQ